MILIVNCYDFGDWYGHVMCNGYVWVDDNKLYRYEVECIFYDGQLRIKEIEVGLRRKSNGDWEKKRAIAIFVCMLKESNADGYY